MMEGILEFNPQVRPLRSISPSRFVGLQNCALREAWAANRAPQLLPSSPAAHLGSVIHSLLQEAGEGKFPVPRDRHIEQRWSELIRVAEDEMSTSWLERHLVPLATAIPQFEVRRIQAWRRALEISSDAVRTPAPPESPPVRPTYGFEFPVTSRDGLVQGRIDAVIPSEQGPVIQDFKSGAVLDYKSDQQFVIKETYVVQLRLYAALYASTIGTWPVRIELVPISGPAEPVSFESSSCIDLLDKARSTLTDTNKIIEQNSDSAHSLALRLGSPSPVVCAYCLYRPGCAAYLPACRASPSNLPWPADIWGTLEGVSSLSNSKLMATIRTADGMVRIRALASRPSRHPALSLVERGDRLALFGLRSTASAGVFVESDFTVIYKTPEPAGSPNLSKHGEGR